MASVAAPATHTVVSAPSPPPVPAALARLRGSLTGTLAKAGPDTGAMVYDLTARRALFERAADVGRPPASVEKLYTSVALLRLLGPDARLLTAVLGAGHLEPGGVWRGSLFLRGGGDPTFGDGAFNRTWEQGYGPAATDLVAQLTSRGVRQVTGHVIGDASLFDALRGGPATGFAADIPDIGGQLAALTYDHGSTSGSLSPGAFAAKELVLTMRGAHIRATAAKVTAAAPPDAQELASVNSPPMSVLLRLMDVPSDDFFAEMLTKQLGARFAGDGSIVAGAQQIAHAIASYGVHPRIVDGSGLSRADRSSPGEVVDLLRLVWHTDIGHVLAESLPVVGVSGTVQHLALKTAAQGHCIAKTGTLDKVSNLAGYCATRDHHVLAFALFLDGPNNSRGYTLLGQLVAAIARY